MEREDWGIVKEECGTTENNLQEKIQELVTAVCGKQSQCAILLLDEEQRQVEHYGTTIGKKFLLDHRDVTQQFLQYCYEGHMEGTQENQLVEDDTEREDKGKRKRKTAGDVTSGIKYKRRKAPNNIDSDVISDKRRKLSVSSEDVEDDDDFIQPDVTNLTDAVTNLEDDSTPDDSSAMTDIQENNDDQTVSSKFPKIVLSPVDVNDHAGYVCTPDKRGSRKSALKFKEFMASMTKSNEKKTASVTKNNDKKMASVTKTKKKKIASNDNSTTLEDAKPLGLLAAEEIKLDSPANQLLSHSNLKKSAAKTGRRPGRKSLKSPSVLLTDKVDESEPGSSDVVTRSGRRVVNKISLQIKNEIEEIIDDNHGENDENWETIDDLVEEDDSGKKRKRKSTGGNKKKKIKKIATDKSENAEDAKIEPKCLECQKEFKTLGLLSSHLKATGHSQICPYETDYRCFTCNVYFLRKCDLTKHMEKTSHTGNAAHEDERVVQSVTPRRESHKILAKYKCSMCKADYRIKENCEEHVKLGTCVPKYYKKCPCCKKGFQNKNMLHVHLKKSHRHEYPFRCPHCQQTFFKKIALEIHKRIHKKADYLGAAINQEGGQEDGDIGVIKTEENVDGETGGNDIKEGVIEVENPTLEDLFTENIHTYLRLKYIKKIQRQLRGVADIDTTVSDDLDGEQICMVCSEKFPNYGALKIHILSTNHEQVTEEETGYKCYTCDKYFVKLADLEDHMGKTSHTGNPPGLELKQALKIEKRNTERVWHQYKCSLCTMEFSTLEKCENHVKNASCSKYYRKKCECCELCFTKKNLYHAHMYQKHQFEFPFKCMRCELEFDIMTCYIAHLRTHLKEKDNILENAWKISCDSCDKKFRNKYQLLVHKRLEHPMQFSEADKKVNLVGSSEVTDYKCYSCDLYFTNLISLEYHGKIEGHTGNQKLEEHPTVLRTASKESTSKDRLKPYKCSRCHDRFTLHSVAEKHVKRNICQQYWRKTCPLCAIIFRFRNMYEAHMLQFHKDEYPFKCENCDRIFYRVSAYNSHRVNIHDREPFRPQPEGTIEVITCKICSRTFRGRGNYNQHMIGLHGDTEKPFVCEQCGSRFSSQRSLKEHVTNTHERDPNNPLLKCRTCHKVLKSVKSRVLHEKIMHTNGSGHTCEICGFTTKRLGNLNYHLAQKHSDEPAYTCNECGIKFRVKPSYNLHMANHALSRGDIKTAETYCKIHKCNFCGRGFSTKQNCEKHKLQHLGNLGKLNCKICGLAIACHTSGLRKHYRLRHFLGPKEVRNMIKDVPSAADLFEQVQKNLNEELPVPVVPIEERRSAQSVPKKKKKKKPAATVKAELEDEESFDALEYESDTYEEYLVLPGAVNSPKKSAAPERDFLAEAMSQIDVIQNACVNPVPGSQSDVVVETVSNTEEIELIIPQGGSQLLIRDETGQLVRPHFITTSQENGTVKIRIQK